MWKFSLVCLQSTFKVPPAMMILTLIKESLAEFITFNNNIDTFFRIAICDIFEEALAECYSVNTTNRSERDALYWSLSSRAAKPDAQAPAIFIAKFMILLILIFYSSAVVRNCDSSNFQICVYRFSGYFIHRAVNFYLLHSLLKMSYCKSQSVSETRWDNPKSTKTPHRSHHFAGITSKVSLEVIHFFDRIVSKVRSYRKYARAPLFVWLIAVSEAVLLSIVCRITLGTNPANRSVPATTRATEIWSEHQVAYWHIWHIHTSHFEHYELHSMK